MGGFVGVIHGTVAVEPALNLSMTPPARDVTEGCHDLSGTFTAASRWQAESLSETGAGILAFIVGAGWWCVTPFYCGDLGGGSYDFNASNSILHLHHLLLLEATEAGVREAVGLWAKLLPRQGGRWPDRTERAAARLDLAEYVARCGRKDYADSWLVPEDYDPTYSPPAAAVSAE